MVHILVADVTVLYKKYTELKSTLLSLFVKILQKHCSSSHCLDHFQVKEHIYHNTSLFVVSKEDHQTELRCQKR